MKASCATAIIFLALMGLVGHSVAQVRVTGHVFAEVVELTGAESNTTGYVSLRAGEPVSDFDLGEISLRGKANTTFELMISSSPLTSDNGLNAFFETRPSYSGDFHSLDHTGSQTIKLTGATSNDLHNGTEKQFAGNYNVVFAYN